MLPGEVESAARSAPRESTAFGLLCRCAKEVYIWQKLQTFHPAAGHALPESDVVRDKKDSCVGSAEIEDSTDKRLAFLRDLNSRLISSVGRSTIPSIQKWSMLEATGGEARSATLHYYWDSLSTHAVCRRATLRM
jgi:hypothetical protein